MILLGRNDHEVCSYIRQGKAVGATGDVPEGSTFLPASKYVFCNRGKKGHAVSTRGLSGKRAMGKPLSTI